MEAVEQPPPILIIALISLDCLLQLQHSSKFNLAQPQPFLGRGHQQLPSSFLHPWQPFHAWALFLLHLCPLLLLLDHLHLPPPQPLTLLLGVACPSFPSQLALPELHLLLLLRPCNHYLAQCPDPIQPTGCAPCQLMTKLSPTYLLSYLDDFIAAASSP